MDGTKSSRELFVLLGLEAGSGKLCGIPGRLDPGRDASAAGCQGHSW